MAHDPVSQDVAEPGRVATRFRRRRFLALCALALLVWLAAVLLLWPSHGALLNWDEVDYVNAAGLGPWANMVEGGSLPISHFVAFAFAKITGRQFAFPEGYDESRDPLLLRHYHPPLVVLLLSPVSWTRSERTIRSVQLLGALALSCAVTLSYLSLSGPPGWSGILVVSLLVLWTILVVFTSLSFHGWEAVWTTASAALLGRWLSTRAKVVGVLLCASLAMAVVTLETGLLVWVAAVLSVLVWGGLFAAGRWVTLRRRHIAVGIVLTVVFVLVVWPGSVLKGSLVKIPAVYLYRIWLGEEYTGVIGGLPRTLGSLLPLVVLGPAACFWLFLSHREHLPRWGPSVVVGGVYGLAMTRFALNPQYLLPALAPLIPLAGLAVDRISSSWGRTLIGMVALVLAGSAWPASIDSAGDRERRNDLRWLGGILRGREALVDGGHVLQYYLGRDYSIRPVTVSYRGESLLAREGGAYRPLGRGDVAGKVVVIQRSREQSFRKTESALLSGCSRIERAIVRVYDCSRTGGEGAGGTTGRGAQDPLKR